MCFSSPDIHKKKENKKLKAYKKIFHSNTKKNLKLETFEEFLKYIKRKC